MMNVGDKAPEVLGLNENGEEVRLSAIRARSGALFLSEG